jgi:hypothetical protein
VRSFGSRAEDATDPGEQSASGVGETCASTGSASGETVLSAARLQMTGEGIEPSTNGLTYRSDQLDFASEYVRTDANDNANSPYIQGDFLASTQFNSGRSVRTGANDSASE